MIRLTSSLCPECFSAVPASISETVGAIWMEKKCPSHGWFRGMVERDPFWFWICARLNAKTIYDGYLIDVTDRCNIKCKYCYHQNGGKDHDVEEIVRDAEAHKHLAPFGLIGGEPTVHEKLPEIYSRLSKIGKTTILTNAVKLCDEEYFESLLKCDVVKGNLLDIALSFHKESGGKDIQFLEMCRSMKLVIPETFFVLDDLGQIDEALSIYLKFPDVIGSMRLKGASNIGAETKVTHKIYVSDILNYLSARGRTDIDTSVWGNKVSFACVRWENLLLFPCSWYGIDNVDLRDIDCGPWYKAKDGKVHNLVTTLLLNEGYDKSGSNPKGH